MSGKKEKEKRAEEKEPQVYPIPEQAQKMIQNAQAGMQQRMQAAQQELNHTLSCIAIGAGVPEGQVRLAPDGKGFVVEEAQGERQ